MSTQSSESWDFAYLIPHAQFEEPIECGPLTLVHRATRVSISGSVLSGHRPADISLHRSIGGRMQPSAILIRSDAPQDVTSMRW